VFSKNEYQQNMADTDNERRELAHVATGATLVKIDELNARDTPIVGDGRVGEKKVLDLSSYVA